MFSTGSLLFCIETKLELSGKKDYLHDTLISTFDANHNHHQKPHLMMIRFPSVYLADDDPDDLEFFKTGLLRLYPQVGIFLFNDGPELLNALGSCVSSHLPYCLIFDYKMPPFGAPQLLEATGPGTPFEAIPKIVWSTSGRQKEIDECLRLGAARYVVKPTTHHELEIFLQSLQIPVPSQESITNRR